MFQVFEVRQPLSSRSSLGISGGAPVCFRGAWSPGLAEKHVFAIHRPLRLYVCLSTQLGRGVSRIPCFYSMAIPRILCLGGFLFLSINKLGSPHGEICVLCVSSPNVANDSLRHLSNFDFCNHGDDLAMMEQNQGS